MNMVCQYRWPCDTRISHRKSDTCQSMAFDCKYQRLPHAWDDGRDSPLTQAVWSTSSLHSMSNKHSCLAFFFRDDAWFFWRQHGTLGVVFFCSCTSQSLGKSAIFDNADPQYSHLTDSWNFVCRPPWMSTLMSSTTMVSQTYASPRIAHTNKERKSLYFIIIYRNEIDHANTIF